MNLYVIRHGRTNNNDKHLFNGGTDEDINQTGIQQAKMAKEKIKSLPIDLIICSPMKRTKHTAQIINDKEIPIIYDERLIERDAGELTLKPNEAVDGEAYWNYHSTKYKNLETVPELFKRVHPVLDEIQEKYKDKNILIVTHNGVARAIYAYFYGLPEDGNIRNIGIHENCEIRKYKMEEYHERK